MSTTPQVVDTSKRVILDYTSRDYKAIRSMLVGLASGLLPDWETVGETGDFGTLLLELYAYVGDISNYYIDRVGSEAFLGTAVRRQSALYIADMLGYQPMGQRAASVPVLFSWTWDTNNLAGGIVPVYTYTVASAKAANGLVTMGITSDTYAIFMTVGQTVTVTGVGAPFDGRFVVQAVVDATATTPVQIIYNIADPAVRTATITGSSQITTGSVVIVPAMTRLSTQPDVNGAVFTFETDLDVTLDTAAGKSTPAAPTVFTVNFATTATEGVTVPPYLLGTSQGIPNAEFVISDPGVIDRSVSVYTKEGGAVVPWAAVTKLALATPTQSVYATYIDDQNFTHVMFGDNTSGRIPPANTQIYIGYRYGSGGAANNVGTGAINVLNNDFANNMGVTVSNPASPVGGTDVESVESMRFSIPRSSALQQRAVTLLDYTALALQVPGVTKATAYGQNYTSVYVRIASGPQSAGYVITPVTGLHVTASSPAVVTLPLDNDYALMLGEFYFLDDVRADLDGTQTPTNIWLSSSASTQIATAVQAGYLVTLTTVTAHTFQQGQPITVTGVTQAVFNGLHVVSAVPDANTIQYYVATTASVTGTISGDEFIAATPGVTFQSTTSTSTVPSGGAGPVVVTPTGPTATVTSVDPEMQKLIKAVEDYLADKKLIGSVVYGEPVEWTDADVNLAVVVRPLYNRESVRAAVQSAVLTVFAYDNVDFGRRISIGDVYRAALSVDGVDYVTISRLAETVGPANPVVADINGTDPYVLTVLQGVMTAGVATLTTFETANLRIGDPIMVSGVGTYYDGTYLITNSTPQSFSYQTPGTLTFASAPAATGAVATQTNDQNLYRIPRINPNLALPWVTATGGLVNT